MPTANKTIAHICLRAIAWRCAAVGLEPEEARLEDLEREEEPDLERE